ncbi:MAG TPA: protein phosphatase 2C domain-containing protein [Kofleriaceae bacterium]
MRIRAAAASVIGARHLRCSKNGQDAALARVDGDVAVAVVCDGCSSGTRSELGAQLGAALFARALTARLRAGASVTSPATWLAVRSDVVRALADLIERMACSAFDSARVAHEYFLFTVVAAAVTPDAAAVWALGDGAYSFGDHTRVLGPFADNAPPYLAYELVGDTRPAHFEVAPPSCGAIIVATDGATDGAADMATGIATDNGLDGFAANIGLERFAADPFLDHPDALRRQLSVLARPTERIDWNERRVVRTPALLQDDCAVGVLRWSVS